MGMMFGIRAGTRICRSVFLPRYQTSSSQICCEVWKLFSVFVYLTSKLIAPEENVDIEEFTPNQGYYNKNQGTICSNPCFFFKKSGLCHEELKNEKYANLIDRKTYTRRPNESSRKATVTSADIRVKTMSIPDQALKMELDTEEFQCKDIAINTTISIGVDCITMSVNSSDKEEPEIPTLRANAFDIDPNFFDENCKIKKEHCKNENQSFNLKQHVNKDTEARDFIAFVFHPKVMQFFASNNFKDNQVFLSKIKNVVQKRENIKFNVYEVDNSRATSLDMFYEQPDEYEFMCELIRLLKSNPEDLVNDIIETICLEILKSEERQRRDFELMLEEFSTH